MCVYICVSITQDSRERERKRKKEAHAVRGMYKKAYNVKCQVNNKIACYS